MKLLAFLKRDLLITLSYRLNLFLSLVSMSLFLFVFYFVGRTFSGSLSPFLEPYGGEYFPYVLIGIAVSSFVAVGLDTLAGEIRGAQVAGNLESLLCTPTSIYLILLGNSLSTFLRAFVTGVTLLFGGFLLLGIPVPLNRAASSILILLLTFAVFLSVGMLSASFIMLFKQGDPFALLFGTSSYFFGGVFFPVEVLPRPIQAFSEILPITHAVRALRLLLLTDAGLPVLIPLVRNLVLFIVLLGPLTVLVFSRSVRRAKISGSLTQF